MATDEGILVTGRASVSCAPDIAVGVMGVSVRSATAAQAVAEAAQAATALSAALGAAGMVPGDVSTTQYAVHQEYRHHEGNSIPDGYRVVNTVRVVIRSVDQVGAILDAVAAAAGEAIEVQGISFELSDDRAARVDARAAAFADAVASATQLAELAGARLSDAVWISEGRSRHAGPGSGPMRAMFAEATTPVSGGELTISAEVEVRFALVKP